MTKKARCFSLLWLVPFLLVLAADLQAASPDQPSSSLLTNTNSYAAPSRPAQRKDPGTAIALATFPGIVIQGSGHFYAGRPVTGAILLLVELGAVTMAYNGGRDIYAVVQENTRSDISDVALVENLSNTSRLSRGIGLAVGGVVLFLSSWFYDMTGAPLAVEEDNQKYTRSGGPELKAKVTSQSVTLELAQTF